MTQSLPAMARTRGKTLAFVSYARSDGETFAGGLVQRLLAQGISLWRDHEGMVGGRDFWQQITEAISSVDVLVLVMTPAAALSEMVRREWRHARKEGVIVYPVLATKGIDFAALPHWMRSVHFYDLDAEWPKFLHDLQFPAEPLRVPFMAESMPDDFVPRPQEMDRLLGHLLDRDREEPLAVTTALRGAGGYGKTALVRALCHQEAIQNAFDDGILWVTLSEAPGSLVGRVEDLIFHLLGERPGFAGLDAATAKLAELLGDRDILFVIDDVWDAAHLHPFMQGGSRCARIITTRNADVLPPQAHRIPLAAMQEREALALIGRGLPEGRQAGLCALAARLGEWPLLLTLANAALVDRVTHSGQTLDSALAYFNLALDKRGLTFFDARDASARHRAVASTLGISIAQLTADERARFEELAVFPEDEPVPLSTVATYWDRTGGLDEFDTEALCERLYRLSLVLDFDPTERYVRLHDVVRQFLQVSLGQRLAALHASLLDALLPSSGAWADLPAQPAYAWTWLFHHLEAAGRAEAMLATAWDLRYLAAKTRHRSTFAAEADLLAACRLAAQAGDGFSLIRLRALLKGYVQSAHLLSPCRDATEVLSTLIARLQHLTVLEPAVGSAAPSLPQPHLGASGLLPDLPHPALLRTLADHRGAVLACAIGPDGARVFTAGRDRMIRVWDALSGVEQQRLTGHTGWVTGLAVSTQGHLLASCSTDRRLRLWALPGGEPLAVLAGHTDGLTACALSPDGRLVVSASLDGALKVWRTDNHRLVHTLARVWEEDAAGRIKPANRQGHWSAVQACDISPDGALLASASSDQTLILWSLADGAALHLLQGHQAGVAGCRFSPDGRWLASAGSDRTIRVWDVRTGESIQVLHSHAPACAVAWATPGPRVWAAMLDGSLVAWDFDSGQPSHEWGGHTGAVSACEVSADGRLLVSAAADGSVRLWDASHRPGRQGEAVPRPSGDWLQCCAVDARGRRVVTGSALGTLAVWDGHSGRHQGLLAQLPRAIHACAVSASGNLFAAAGADRSLQVWDGPGGAPLHVFAGHRHRVNACAFDRATTLLASVSSDGSLRLWDVRTRSRKLALRAHQHEVNACAISSDGQRVATGSEDGTVVFWALDGDDSLWERWLEGDALLPEAQVQSRLRPLAAQTSRSAVNGLAFASDDAWLAAACSDHSVALFSPVDGRRLRGLAGHQGPVTGCAAHPGGPWLASTAADGELRIWDAAAGRCQSTVRVDGALLSCAWVDEGRGVVAVGANGLYRFDWTGGAARP